MHDTEPASLTVHLQDCPIGYEISSESGECACNRTLISYNIVCIQSNLSLLITAQTWVGVLKEGLAVQVNCQHCKNEKAVIIQNITKESHQLCISNGSLTTITGLEWWNGMVECVLQGAHAGFHESDCWSPIEF